MTLWVDPAPSIRTSTDFPRRPPGSWRSASVMTAMWSVVVFDPALPGRRRIARGSPVPAAPWSTNAHNGWKPNPFLNVGLAFSFSLWEVTRVASTSTTTRWRASAPWSGAWVPAAPQTRARAVALARSIAGRTFSTSAARRAIVRDRVGSEATGPKTAGSARTTARSEQVSPPSARVIARSSRTLAGSCIADGDRHGANDPYNSTSRPAARTVEPQQHPAGLADRQPAVPRQRSTVGRTRYSSSPGRCSSNWTDRALEKPHHPRSGALCTPPAARHRRERARLTDPTEDAVGNVDGRRLAAVWRRHRDVGPEVAPREVDTRPLRSRARKIVSGD